ncbi:MAG: hypothetical protein P8M67_01660 [Opitutales bacterium]|nr:hypothetical protein [Opitutales bacterium]
MNIEQIDDVKELKALKAKIERKIKSQKKKPKKSKLSDLYPLIKDDHKRHVRPDGRKVFRSVADYLECYVRGLAPIAKAEFYSRFGIESKRGKVTQEVILKAKELIASGQTLQSTADACGISVASCQKIKSGAYDS